MRILVADAKKSFLDLVAQHLTSWGYDVQTVTSGADAWRVLRKEGSPTLAILDWTFADLSGVELCRMVRATPHGAGVYVILAVNRDELADVVDAREAGVDDLLVKPLVARELMFRVARGLAFREGRPRPRLTSIPPPSGYPSSIPPSLTPPSLPPVAEPQITLAGRYRLERKIAEGSAATVWLGLHLSLGVQVAVKFMKPASAEDVDYPSFEADARAAAQLRSDNIARVYGHGSHEGLPFVAMEYLGGESLAAKIAREGPLPIDTVVALVEQVACGLEDAHAHDVLHGGVRPENIVLTHDVDRPEGFCAKLVDFGFLKAALTTTTEPPSGTGTSSYTSPECLKGDEPSRALDLWGLAATAFTAATGARPFGADTVAQVFARVCLDPLPVPSETHRGLPRTFDTWFARACARSPQDRYASASQLSAALVAARRSDRIGHR